MLIAITLIFMTIIHNNYPATFNNFMASERGWGLFLEPYFYIFDEIQKFVTK